MDKNGRLPLQLNIDTSFLYRDTLAPHPGIVKPALGISAPGGTGVAPLVSNVTPPIIPHLPSLTVLNNVGPLPVPRNQPSKNTTRRDMNQVKKSNSSCKKLAAAKNDVCELQGNTKCYHKLCFEVFLIGLSGVGREKRGHPRVT